MADPHDAHNLGLPPPTSTPSSSIFGRRPSFFGRSKPNTAPGTGSRAPSRTATTPPVHPNLPPALAPALAPAPAPAPAAAEASTTSTSTSTSTSTGDVPPAFPSQYEFPPKGPSTPPRRKHSRSRHSISSLSADIGTSLRRSRSASLRTNTSSAGTASSSHKRDPSATLASFSPEKPAASQTSRPTLSISTFSRKQKSAENVKPPDGGKQVYEKSPLSAVDNPKTPFAMNVPHVPHRYPPTQKEVQLARQQSNLGPGLGQAAPVGGGVNPNAIFQHIHELASKRISTLDYLRKAHEGRIYWFNTLLFAKNDLTRLPSFTPRNLSRRATNYLLLGFSLPTILDLNANSPTDYLKALNALLAEFEQYQSIHPPDGSTPSSLSRGRMGQMFKKSVMGGKGRRSSSAAGDFPMLHLGKEHDSMSGLEGGDDHLLPNESYIHLQTPSLPFDPDFFSTFATLCDVLIDCYTKILTLLSTPESVVDAGGGVPSTVGDLFSKADARVRKIILGGVVREFEESCRLGVRGESEGKESAEMHLGCNEHDEMNGLYDTRMCIRMGFWRFLVGSRA
ncbi:hypothetical protein P154DRAFT_625193 [Amniculicola lignicola CBS 123094]|uniref:Uncharacterized protein n=1 Tax=Amniculicola lignicola CBS 123094 TaxID=1392246 RepID=A0A6A5VXY7_9PLEO|nr:hypothetical protein P154DRAFT_625193 [Amniculicola lignicola CBS 123094]